MNAACTQGAIRLVGGANEMEGRVEVCNNNMWGTICDYGWDLNDARVACWQSGFSSSVNRKLNYYCFICHMSNFVTAVVTSFTNAAFGEGVGPIWMSNLTCVYNENSLFLCSRQVQIGWVENSTSCSHSNDVAVRCSPRNGKISLFLLA